MAVIASDFSVVIPEDIQSYPLLMLQKFKEHGNKVAIVDSKSGRSYTFKQLHLLIRKCGSALLRRGFKPKSVLAVILPNIPEFAVILYGATAVGGIVTTMNPLYTSHELAYQLKDSGTLYVVTIPQLLNKVKSASDKAGVKEIFVFGEADGFESLSNMMHSDDGLLFQMYEPVNPREEVVFLPYSSGTTGLPKGVMLTHYNMIAHMMMIAYEPSGVDLPTVEQVVLGLLPMFHIYGLAILLGFGLYRGSKVVCINGFEPEAFLRAVQDYKVNKLTIVPPIAIFLAKHPLVKKFDLTHVESITCGAAPLGEDTIKQLRTRFPEAKCTIRQGYGLTETSPVCMASPSYVNIKNGSVGKVMPNMQAKVIDLKSGILLGPGHNGEICVKGPNVMKGYLNKPEATANTIDRDGWLHTGDIGHYDEDRHFYIVDRVKELIKYKGFQVPPAELEAVLLSHTKISDAAVIGIPNPEAGEIPKAFIITSGDISEQEVMDFVKDKVAPHKQLRGGVEFVKSIPKNASGKIMRRQLREQEKEKLKRQTKQKL